MANNDILELRQKIERNLHDKSKPWATVFKYLEDTLGIDRQYIFWGCIIFIALWLAFGYAGQLICSFIGVVYPAYCSIHAIESRTTEDDTKWLTYWIVFSLFSIGEYFADIIVGWIPIYWLVKSMFCLWLMLPTNFNGSLVIYKHIIQPYFLQYHKEVDKAVNAVQEKVSELMDKKK